MQAGKIVVLALGILVAGMVTGCYLVTVQPFPLSAVSVLVAGFAATFLTACCALVLVIPFLDRSQYLELEEA